MHYLITGGSGFIGSHLVEELLSCGHKITVVDDFSTGNRHNLADCDDIIFLKKNILECKAEDLMTGCAGLIHLAATPSVTQSWHAPLASHNNNISATVAILELCQKLAIPRLVFASSAAVYGNPNQVPISEDTPTQPISPYGLQKLASEQYIALFAKHLGISAVNLRLFNVFGPRQDPSSPYSGVISIFAKAMSQGLPISINGDGSQTRDFVYVKDVAAAFSNALTTPLASGTTLTCNIGTGKAVSLMQLKETLQSCFPEWQSPTTLAPPRPGDIQDSQADITKAEIHLGFAPQFSLQAGLLALKQSLG
ncbi:NAD-dependent epimerase/dehydratase family protein [Nodosilinea sp. PGN35]|uniref:NAD-dependent epimerase/dehydratase family protein n=1 Tax=Nodosilinea sp. PGN35 TaxID=3020489 RepID=UPI0023B21238|nr:NAD-dependent epimerase/dehydratase family protein [Nodosilinea sp. TSF1-S3]MDF0367339.1 NAD-dependent epimerase/dehydratase family protein [Nodosilinea sp. TSF1-S3]